METHIIKAVLREAGRPPKVQLYYVTVKTGGDPLAVFDSEDTTPDLTSAFTIDTLTADEASGFGFKEGEIRNVLDA